MCNTELFFGRRSRRVRPLVCLGVLLVSFLTSGRALAIGSVNLAWDRSPSTNLSGYIVRYATTSGQYTMSTNVGTVTNAIVGGLQEGVTYYLAVTAVNTSGLESDPSNEVSYSVPLAGPPTISAIANQTTAEDSPIAAYFTVLSTSVPAGNLTLSATSSNTGLLPVANIAFGGSGSNRSVVLTPWPGRSGSATVTVTVSDGTATASRNFSVTVSPVKDVPTLGSIPDRAILEDSATQTVTLSGISSGDANESQILTVTATSSNPALIPHPTVNYTSPNATGSLSFAPVANASGTATIAVTVNDGQLTNNLVTRAFTVTVTPVNDVPTITAIADQTVPQNSSSGAIGFSIGDVETAPAALTLAASSSNPTLVPLSGIVFGGTGGSRTVTVTPAQGQSGVAAITVTVTDGNGGSSSDAFTLTVTASNPPPSIVLTSPTSGGNYAAPATVSLAASVNANGNSISKVQFYNGATLLGEAGSAPYTFSWSGVSAGTYTVSARVIYGAGSTANSPSVNISVTGLPAPWQTTDLGTVGAVGSASASTGIFSVTGAGNISGRTDNFRFVHQSLTGDGEIKVRLNTVGDTGNSGRVGVMVRESLTSGSRYAFMGISPDGRFRWQRRSSTSGSTSSTASTYGTVPNVWLRLVRTGNTLYGYRSTDGVTWTLVNSRSISMAVNIHIGLAVASGASTTLNASSSMLSSMEFIAK